MNSVSSLYHFVAATVYIYGLYYHLWYTKPIQGADVIGGKFKFLTFWNLILQTFFFVFCFINDIVGTNIPPKCDQGSRSKLQKFRDNIFASLAIPVGTFVELTFWALYFVDRELVFPKFLDKAIPSWFNHLMHTTVVLFLLIESCVIYHHFPRRKTGLLILVFFSGLYNVWIQWIAYYANFWVYPILEVLSAAQRACFVLLLWVLLIGIYMLGESWNKFVWRKEISNSPKKNS